MFQSVQTRKVRGASGDVREIMAETDRGFFSVEIECFVKDPPPPGLRPCPQCGVLASRTFRSGQPVQIDLDDMAPGNGEVRLAFVDADERRTLVLKFGENQDWGRSSPSVGA